VDLLEAITDLFERAARPGLLGAPGKAVERACRSDLFGYFSKISRMVNDADLGKLVASEEKDIVLHAIDMSLHNILRKNSTDLMQVLALNIHAGFLLGIKQDVVVEADIPVDFSATDKVGPTAMDAAVYAAEKSAELVTQIDDTTRQIIRDAVAKGFEEQLSPLQVNRLIRQTLTDMTIARSKMIARTEMADAIGEASMRKIKAEGYGWKQTILSDDACQICQDNADADPLPVDELYPSGDLRAAFHPNCRCTTTAARPPEGE
jgi:hypothetical protein